MFGRQLGPASGIEMQITLGYLPFLEIDKQAGRFFGLASATLLWSDNRPDDLAASARS
jgi:hypothetical protein